MGNDINCCKTNQELFIEQMIEQDRVEKSKSAPRKLYNEEDVAVIQKHMRGYCTRKKFNQRCQFQRHIITEELKHCSASGETISVLYTDKLKEVLSRHEPYETTEYYTRNIKRVMSNRYLVNTPNYGPHSYGEEVYQGSVNLDNKYHGYGILMKNDGSVYQGFWDKGILSGFVRYVTKLGDFYEGNLINGKAQGQGKYITYDGTIYEGAWDDDQPNGYGQEIFPDHSTFTGNYKQGKKFGQGTFVWTDGSTFTGEVKEDALNGKGLYKWADGRIYEGEWLNNKMHGRGRLVFANKSYYEGDFVNNTRTGFGLYYWNEKKYFEGHWLNGKQQGKGKYVKGGKIVEGIWNNGKVANHSEIFQRSSGFSETHPSISADVF